MIAFSPLRTKRLTIRLKEMSIGDAIYLCKLPVHLTEAGTGELLDRIIKKEDKANPNQLTDHRLFTVQERALNVAHYLSQTSENPDVPVGDGRYSDYLDMSRQEVHAKIDLGKVGTDECVLYPLLGIHSESIERLVVSGRVNHDRSGWWMGAMGAMLYRKGEERPDNLFDAALDDHIAARAQAFSTLPDTEFMQVLMLFLDGIEKQDHFFRLVFLDDGIAFMPMDRDKEVQGLPPARFLFSSAVSESAAAVFGGHG